MKTINYLTILSVILFGMNLSATAQTTIFPYTGTINTYVVPAGITSISISVSGAQGGSSTFGAGGTGANMAATFIVTPGQVLDVIVGQQPASVTYCAGGGGGSFVWDDATSTLYIAGGGGGGGSYDLTGSSIGIGAVTSPNGTPGGGGLGFGGAGTGGHGGVALTGTCHGEYGAGGAGWLSNGAGGVAPGCTSALGGATPLTGGAGGTYGGTLGEDGNGGFGGGGGGQGTCTIGGGGGGGGYSGGGGGDYTCGLYSDPGGGGGSYYDNIIGSALVFSVGNTGNGAVTITTLCSAGPIEGATTLCLPDTASLSTDSSGGTWSSTNTGVATIDTFTGFVTAVSAGTTIITYSATLACGSVYSIAVLTVNPAPAPISGPSTICAGLTTDLTDVSAGTWTSSITSVATVGPTTGIVTGVSGGTSIITFSNGVGPCSVMDTITVNPLPTPITGIMQVCLGLTTTLTGGLPGGTWSSSNAAMASVGTSTGIVTGVSVGTAIITYQMTATGCIATTEVTVNPMPGAITGFGNVCLDQDITLSDPSGGGTWSSGNTAVGTIGVASGILYGASVGTTIITYALSTGCVATDTILVISGALPITGSLSGCQGIADTLHDATGGGTWSSSRTTVAAIGSVTGIVTGVSSGTAIITYKVGTGCITTATFTVHPVPDSILGTTNLCQSLSTTLTDPTPGGIWSSDDTLIASVGSTSGVVTAITTGGTTYIRYTLPTGCQTAIGFHVHIPPSPLFGDNVMCQGGADTLTMSVYTYLTGGIWSSSSVATASVTDLGYPLGALVLGVSAGTSVISYTILSCPPSVDTVLVNPLPAPINGLTSICTGLPVSLSDSSAGGTWSSSDTAVAVVDSVTGVVTTRTAILGSSTVIIYTLPTGCLINTVVTVNAAPAPIIPSPDSVCQGESVTLSDSIAGGTWTSTDLAIAQVVDSSGIVTGISGGIVNISYTLYSGCYATIPFKVKPPIPATVSVAKYPDTIICAGQSVTLVATTTNAGEPTFAWQKFLLGTPVGSTIDTVTYTPVHGDVILCEVITHGVCSVKDTVYDTVALNVYPDVVTPLVSIITSDTIDVKHVDTSYTLAFPGQVFTFYSSVIYGGTNQAFKWYANGVESGTGSSYSAAVYGSDTIYCIVTGNPPCDTTMYTTMSNIITIDGGYLGVNAMTVTNSGLTLFPNPNNGGFTLSGNMNAQADGNLGIEVSDVLGQIVYSGIAPVQNGKVNVPISLDKSLANGAYILKISSATDNMVFHFMISK